MPSAHGTHTRYCAGCRCLPCRVAKRAYCRAYYRRTGRKVHKVSSSATREHILALAQHGIGADTIAACCEVGSCTVRRIKLGRQPLIYQRTEQRILSVTPEGVADGCRIDPALTRRLLTELLEEGWTARELARMLGYDRSSLFMLRSKKVFAITQLKVEKLYRRLQRDGQIALPERAA